MNNDTQPTTGAQREMTYGEKAVGITFNPGGNETVNKLKQLYAEIIDTITNDEKNKENVTGSDRSNLVEHAIREAQTAQMWAVKAATYPY